MNTEELIGLLIAPDSQAQPDRLLQELRRIEGDNLENAVLRNLHELVALRHKHARTQQGDVNYRGQCILIDLLKNMHCSKAVPLLSKVITFYTDKGSVEASIVAQAAEDAVRHIKLPESATATLSGGQIQATSAERPEDHVAQSPRIVEDVTASERCYFCKTHPPVDFITDRIKLTAPGEWRSVKYLRCGLCRSEQEYTLRLLTRLAAGCLLFTALIPIAAITTGTIPYRGQMKVLFVVSLVLLAMCCSFGVLYGALRILAEHFNRHRIEPPTATYYRLKWGVRMLLGHRLWHSSEEDCSVVDTMHAPAKPRCDVCNGMMSWEEGHVLTTTQITTTEAYWTLIWSGPQGRLFKSMTDNDALRAYVANQAGQRDGWLVCESCSANMTFDRETARAYARQRNSHPAGSGPAPYGLSMRAAEAAWKKLYDSWPL